MNSDRKGKTEILATITPHEGVRLNDNAKTKNMSDILTVFTLISGQTWPAPGRLAQPGPHQTQPQWQLLLRALLRHAGLGDGARGTGPGGGAGQPAGERGRPGPVQRAPAGAGRPGWSGRGAGPVLREGLHPGSEWVLLLWPRLLN